MKQSTVKLYSLFFLIICQIVFSQTVSLTPSNLGCKNSGIITVATSGITTPTFQLQLADGTVIAPVAGDNTVFTNSNVFTALTNGTYKAIARDNLGNLFTSPNVIVVDGYTNMSLTLNPVSLPCPGATKAVPVSLTGGKSPYTYQIKNASNVNLETSASTSATSYNFAALPQGTYTVSVTDACGVVVVGTVLVNNPTANVGQLNVGFTVQGYPNNCGAARLFAPGGFTNSGVALTATERSLFTYKIKYSGNLYGVDTSGDGFPDLNTNGIALNAFILQNLPLGVTRNDYYNPATRPTIVVSDQCGNTKEIAISISKDAISATLDCTVGGKVRPTLQASLLCTPVNFTFTNISDPTDVKSFVQTVDGQTFSGLTPGATYNIAYTDSNGNTSAVNYGFANTQVIVPAGTAITASSGFSKNVDFENFGKVGVSVSTLVFGDPFTFEVVASNNPSVPIGFSGTSTQGANALPRPNTSCPIDNWPDGTYTLKITIPCGSTTTTVTVKGYDTPVIAGNTITPICGGFNYVMNGTFIPSSDFVVDIISGPTNVGLSKSLVSSSASDVFTNLGYGTYTAGIRVSSGSRYMNTQTFSFGANGVIIVDKDNTGGYVCNSGATDGTLTIVASTISPAPGNVLQYRISTDGGSTYGAWQNSNVFSGLTNTTYTFQVKDGCGFVVTDNVQVGSVSSPQASANIGAVCELDSITVIQLGVDTANASYVWTGPGITASNQNQRNPILNINDLNIGANNYTVNVTAPFCSNSSSASTVVTKLPSTRPAASSGIELPSNVGISTKGSTKWLTTTKNGAMVLESSDKGFVITRMKTSELPTGSSAVKGMVVYDTDVNCMKLYNGTVWNCITRVCP